MDVSVVIPVYNGEKSVKRLYEAISENLKNAGRFEVLFIYDCGSDNSWQILKKLQKDNPDNVRIYKLKKNYGQHNAILFGFSIAAGNLFVTMDEDLQHDPRYLIPMLDIQRDRKLDVVYGRFSDSRHSFLRRVASGILRTLLKFLIPGLGYYSSYRIIRKNIAQELIFLNNSYTFIDASLNLITKSIGFLEISHRENTTRKSTYSIFKLFSHVIQIILAYSGIIKYLYTISIFLLVSGCLISWFELTRSDFSIGLITFSVILILIAIAGHSFQKYKLKNNLFPVLADEND